MTESSVTKPHFDGTINYGHLLTAFTICVSLLGTGAYQVQQNTQMQTQLAQIQNSVDAFGPRIGSLEASNQLNSERITNAAESNRSFRADFNSTINSLREKDTQLATDISNNRLEITGLKIRDEERNKK